MCMHDCAPDGIHALLTVEICRSRSRHSYCGNLYLQVLLANVLVKIGAVFTIALPLVWLGGLLYHCTSGESLQVSLFKVYAVLYRAPGKLQQLWQPSSLATDIALEVDCEAYRRCM